MVLTSFTLTRPSRQQLIEECEGQIDTINTLVDQTKLGKLQVLRSFYQQVVPIKAFVRQELVVYSTHNLFEQSPTGTLLVADAWIPAYATETIKTALEDGAAAGAKGGSFCA